MENEKLGFQVDTLEPITMDNIHDLLDGMASRFGHKRIMEGDTIIALVKVQHFSYSLRLEFHLK